MTSLGFEITGLIVGSVLLGQWLDQKYALKGFFTAGLVLISFAGWMIRIVKVLKKLNTPSE